MLGEPDRSAAVHLRCSGPDKGCRPTGPASYRLLAEIGLSTIAADPDPAAKAVQTGRAWGGFLIERPAPGVTLTEDEAVHRLLDLLTDIGFAPEQQSSVSGSRIGLRNCPFLELVENQPQQIICQLHLGLMQGAMAALNARTHRRPARTFRRTRSLPRSPQQRRYTMTATATAATFVWLGMVLGHLLPGDTAEVPAPGVDLPTGLAIGRLVFRRLQHRRDRLGQPCRHLPLHHGRSQRGNAAIAGTTILSRPGVCGPSLT